MVFWTLSWIPTDWSALIYFILCIDDPLRNNILREKRYFNSYYFVVLHYH